MEKSLFSSGNKSAKSSLYKKEIFADSEKSAKNIRTKIRKYLESVNNFFKVNNTLNEEQMNDFLNTYKDTYLKNDFSVASIYDGANNEYKEELKNLLTFAKKANDKMKIIK